MEQRFHFWQPPAGYTIKSGPDQVAVPVPVIPLPLLVETGSDHPTDLQIGEGLYAYLRQSPDGDRGREYALLMQDAFPHYIADLAAHAVMLDHKQVDSPYLKRQINCLKILALLEPENAALYGQVGVAYYQVALMFQELPNSRFYLLQSLKYLGLAHNYDPEKSDVINYLAQVNYLIGDYPAALQLWQSINTENQSPDQLRQLTDRICQLETWNVPDYPLSDDLEAVGRALELFSNNQFGPAKVLLEGVEARQYLLDEFSFPEFHYLLGLCHVELNDLSAARKALESALARDPEFLPAREKLDTLFS